jgi:hypothetical protein
MDTLAGRILACNQGLVKRREVKYTRSNKKPTRRLPDDPIASALFGPIESIIGHFK